MSGEIHRSERKTHFQERASARGAWPPGDLQKVDLDEVFEAALWCAEQVDWFVAWAGMTPEQAEKLESKTDTLYHHAIHLQYGYVEAEFLIALVAEELSRMFDRIEVSCVPRMTSYHTAALKCAKMVLEAVAEAVDCQLMHWEPDKDTGRRLLYISGRKQLRSDPEAKAHLRQLLRESLPGWDKALLASMAYKEVSKAKAERAHQKKMAAVGGAAPEEKMESGENVKGGQPDQTAVERPVTLQQGAAPEQTDGAGGNGKGGKAPSESTIKARMLETSPAQRLREIADEIRCLPETFKQRLPGEVARAAGALLDEAMGLGAFAGPEYAKLRTLVARQKREFPNDWQQGTWGEGVTCLAPDLEKEQGVVEAIALTCGPIADLINAEAANLERGSAKGQSAGSAQERASAGTPAGEAREGGGKDPEVALESLPTDSPPGDAESSEVRPVVLMGSDKNPIVRGKEKKPLTRARYDVVEALLEAGPSGLTKDQLDNQSGHTDARKLLKAVAALDEDWAAVIHMAVTTGGGYRIQ